jgi:hypothetical protein
MFRTMQVIYSCLMYILRLYVWSVICCFAMLCCQFSGLVELIVIVQAQHINNKKYSNPHTMMNVDRQTELYQYYN